MCYSCRHARGPYTVQQSPGRPASWNPGARWTQRPRTAHLLEISRVAQIAIQYKLIISIATTHSTLAHTGCMGASLHTAKPRGGIVARTRHGCTQTRSSTQARTSGEVARSQLSAWVQCMPIAPAHDPKQSTSALGATMALRTGLGVFVRGFTARQLVLFPCPND